MRDMDVLGPVLVAGQPVRGRLALLAVQLALVAPRVVPQGVLSSRVLGGDGPKDLDELRVLVSRLRRRLRERGSSATVVHETVGYALRGAATDASEFDDMVDRALAARHDDPAVAEADLVRALSLWRGQVLDEFDGDAAVRRLRERRISALVARFDVAFDRDGHGEVLADLLTACREFSHDEELHRLAMVALYRCGRQSDALRLFQEIRGRLVEDLGVEPGERLRSTELSILRQDPVVGRRRVAVHDERPDDSPVDQMAAAPAAWVTPPPSYADRYVGTEAMAAVRAAVVPGAGPVSLVGPAGVGKSRLAVESLVGRVTGHEHAAFCELSGADEGSLAATVARAVGARVPPNADPVEAIASHLSTDAWLLVLDTCEHLSGAVATLVTQLQLRAPTASIVTTSRTTVGVDGEHVIAVAPLAPADAVRLFVDRSRQVGATHDVGDLAVEQLCRRLDGLPLAIELAASRARAFSASELVELLDRRHDLLARQPVDGRGSGLRASLDWSYSLLSDDERLVLRSLGAFAGPVPLEAIAAVAGRRDVAVTVAALVDHSLVVPRRLGALTQFALLDSTRAFTRTLLDEAGEWMEIRHRHADWVAAHKDSLVPSTWGDGEADAVAALERLRVELRPAVQWATEHELPGLLAHLLAGLGESALLREWTELQPWAEAACGAVSVGADGVRAAEVRAVAAIANWTHGDFGSGVRRTDEAWESVAAVGVEPGVDFYLAAVINAGARDMATFAEQAREVGQWAAAAGHVHGRLWALNGEGMAHAYHGRFSDALAVLALAEISARQAGSRSQLAMCLFARTIALLDEDPAGALAAADACLTNAAEVRASWLVGAVANYRAAALVRAGRPDVAAAEVRDLCRRLAGGGTVQSAANTVRNAIALLDRLDQPARAASLIGWLDANPVGIPGTPGMRAHVDDLRTRLERLVPAGALAAARAEGAAWSHGEVVAVVGRLLADLR